MRLSSRASVIPTEFVDPGYGLFFSLFTLIEPAHALVVVQRTERPLFFFEPALNGTGVPSFEICPQL